ASLFLEIQEKFSDPPDFHEVDYGRTRAAKRTLLEQAWTHFPNSDQSVKQEFESFKAAEKDWLDDYCLFRWLMDVHGPELSWNFWPQECQTPDGARNLLQQRLREEPHTEARIEFFAFVQWLCFRQWRDLRA